MTLDDTYHILLVVLSASLSAHVIFSKSKDIWVALILITAMITELNTISYHNYNTLLYQLYAVLTSWIMLLFFKTLTLSSLKKKIMTGMLGFLVIAGVINFMFFDSSVVIPVHFMVFSEPFIIMAALMVLGDFIKHSEKLEEQPRNLSVIVISILFYFCLLYTSPTPRDRTRARMPSSA